MVWWFPRFRVFSNPSGENGTSPRGPSPVSLPGSGGLLVQTQTKDPSRHLPLGWRKPSRDSERDGWGYILLFKTKYYSSLEESQGTYRNLYKTQTNLRVLTRVSRTRNVKPRTKDFFNVCPTTTSSLLCAPGPSGPGLSLHKRTKNRRCLKESRGRATEFHTVLSPTTHCSATTSHSKRLCGTEPALGCHPLQPTHTFSETQVSDVRSL